jgi:hypothetical protein
MRGTAGTGSLQYLGLVTSMPRGRLRERPLMKGCHSFTFALDCRRMFTQ